MLKSELYWMSPVWIRMKKNQEIQHSVAEISQSRETRPKRGENAGEGAGSTPARAKKTVADATTVKMVKNLSQCNRKNKL